MSGQLEALHLHGVEVGELGGIQGFQGAIKLIGGNVAQAGGPAAHGTGVCLVEIQEMLEVGIGDPLGPDFPCL